jgi:peptidoglycan/LPS O-acetylase OafA/YrhL
MLYEAYQKKINRIARILARIVRLLPLIIAILAVTAALIAGYAVIKGMVVSTECPA